MVSCLMIRPAEEFLVRTTLIISMEQNRLKTLSCTNWENDGHAAR